MTRTLSSIASVISTKKPQASLAVAELVGGGIFVTTVVVAAIIFVKPFKVAGVPFLRDAGFYLLALAWLAFTVRSKCLGYLENLTVLDAFLKGALCLATNHFYYTLLDIRHYRSSDSLLLHTVDTN